MRKTFVFLMLFAAALPVMAQQPTPSPRRSGEPAEEKAGPLIDPTLGLSAGKKAPPPPPKMQRHGELSVRGSVDLASEQGLPSRW